MQILASKAFTSTGARRVNKLGRMAPARVQKLLADLKAYGERNSFKQTELAEKLGIGPQQLNDWFRGRREPTTERALQIIELIKSDPKPEAKKQPQSNKRPKKDQP